MSPILQHPDAVARRLDDDAVRERPTLRATPRDAGAHALRVELKKFRHALGGADKFGAAKARTHGCIVEDSRRCPHVTPHRPGAGAGIRRATGTTHTLVRSVGGVVGWVVD